MVKKQQKTLCICICIFCICYFFRCITGSSGKGIFMAGLHRRCIEPAEKTEKKSPHRKVDDVVAQPTHYQLQRGGLNGKTSGLVFQRNLWVQTTVPWNGVGRDSVHPGMVAISCALVAMQPVRPRIPMKRAREAFDGNVFSTSGNHMICVSHRVPNS